MMKKIFSALMLFLSLALSSTADAHHSYDMFDRTKEITLEGTVINFDWANPHCWLYLAVPDGKGGVVRWEAEMAPISYLMRTGWTNTTLKPGDMVELSLYALKNGTSGGHLTRIKTARGVILRDGMIRPMDEDKATIK